MGVHLHLKNSSRRVDEQGHGGGSVVPPKGCMGILVGTGGEQPQRFVVPVVYLNHPLFLSLLKEAEEEYGFEQKGAITIPCHVEHFRQVQGIIDRDTGVHGMHGHGHGHEQHGGNHHHHHHNQNQNQNNFPIVGCFRA